MQDRSVDSNIKWEKLIDMGSDYTLQLEETVTHRVLV